MSVHPPTMVTKEPRLITAGCVDLPPDFYVVQADDAYEALEEVRLAFMENADITLVVWPDAPVIIDPLEGDESAPPVNEAAVKRALSQLSQGTRWAMHQIRTRISESSWHYISHDADDSNARVRAHFDKISAATRSFSDALNIWRQSVEGLSAVMEDVFSARKMILSTRFQSAAYDLAGIHSDNALRSNSLRVLRVLDGACTRYYSRDDVAQSAHPIGAGHALKMDAQPWVLKPWDIAFVSQNVVHEAPEGADAARRLLEVFDIKSREEFIKSAHRPLVRRLFSTPAYARLDYEA